MSLKEYAYFDGGNYRPLGDELQSDPEELANSILGYADAGFTISYREISPWEELDDYWIEGIRDGL